MTPRKKRPPADRVVYVATHLSRAEAAAFDSTLGDLHRTQLLRRIVLEHIAARAVAR
jgi:hypothetical protein